ncbi:MAG: Mitochondrial import inner membrane translocase subunit tim8 [Alyxoria varia]|nr:MAG: Mitochondrial import inner membrane translocase subunit tim8 [Alyxoria varia]
MSLDPSSVAPLDSGSLSATQRQDIQLFAQQESQKAAVKDSIHNLTSICFRKCISNPSSPSTTNVDASTTSSGWFGSSASSSSQGFESPNLDAKSEEPCLRNCVNRFLDVSGLTLKSLEKERLR